MINTPPPVSSHRGSSHRVSSRRTFSCFRGGLVAVLLFSLSACVGEEGTGTSPQPGGGAAASAKIPAAVFVDTAPADAIEVREAILSAKPGADIVVRAVVGGRKKAFVDGRAVLVAADTRLAPCGSGEGCPTPWDYCCESKETLAANTMTVQIVDAKGTPLGTDLKGAHGLDELKSIVVAGTVRNVEGSLVVDAKKIYVADK